MDKEVVRFIKDSSLKTAVLKKLTDPENKDNVWPFLVELVARLSADKKLNYLTLKAILKRLTFISQFNVNKRLQLEAGLLWNT